MVFFCNWGNSFFGMVVFLLLFTSQAWSVKFVFPKKATKIDEIFTVDLTLCSKCQIGGEYFVNFCGLLRKINFNLHGSNLQYFVSGIEESILFWSFIKRVQGKKYLFSLFGFLVNFLFKVRFLCFSFHSRIIVIYIVHTVKAKLDVGPSALST